MESEQKTIVIVEDEQDAADLFEEMLRVNGFRTVKTHDSDAAMKLILEEKPAAVILDIMMPIISGLEILQYMRKQAILKDTPVIVVSANSLPVDIKAALDAGATLYLTKPVGYKDLKSAIEQVLKV